MDGCSMNITHCNNVNAILQLLAQLNLYDDLACDKCEAKFFVDVLPAQQETGTIAANSNSKSSRNCHSSMGPHRIP